jgi:Ceramidase
MSTPSTQRIIAAWIMVIVFAVFCTILLLVALPAGNTEVLIGAGWFILLMAIFFFLLSRDWFPGSADDSCIAESECFCEHLLTGANKVKQPVNTWSDLGFVAAGLLVFLLMGAGRLSGSPTTNPLQATTFYAVVYGLLVIFLGPGSMFFHASMKKWGGWFDNMSMVGWTFFLLIYLIAQGLHWDSGIAALIWLAAVALAGVVIWFVDGSGKFIFGGAVAVWGVLEIIVLIANGGFLGLQRTEWYWLLAAAIAFGAAIFIWQRSKDGQPWCDPDSWAQGHAAWHLLSALSAFFIFLYLRSEIRI